MFYIVLLSLCCFLFIIWRSRVFRNQHLEPPDLCGKLPLIGHAHCLIGDAVAIYNVVVRMSEDSLNKGGVTKLHMGPVEIYVVSDPDDCLTIAKTCLKKYFLYNFARSVLGNGLITANVPTWIKNRKLLNPAFNQHVLDGFIDIFNIQAQKLVDQFANKLGKEFNHEQLLRKNNMETICCTAIGIDADQFESLQKQYMLCFEELLRILNVRSRKFWLHNKCMYSMSSLKMKEDETLKDFVELTNSIIQKKKCEMTQIVDPENKSRKSKPFLELLLELTAENSNFTEEQIHEETNTILAAAHDTSASALTFALTLLGSNVHVQEKAYKEILQVLGNTDANVGKEALANLVYIEAILKETLRLYPSALLIARQLDTSVKLKNYTLKANTGCVLSIYGVNRHKMWGDDANTFRPERWLQKDTLPDPKYYASFGLGRRSCIGKVYAMMSMKIIIAKVLLQYRIKSDVSQMVVQMEATIRPASGHFISLQQR